MRSHPLEIQPVTYLRGMRGWPAIINNALLTAATLLVDGLVLLGAATIIIGSGEASGRRLALWGAGALLFVVVMGWLSWAVLR